MSCPDIPNDEDAIMLHTVTCPTMGHSILHHFAEGAAVWGNVITPSVAHVIQSHRELAIGYSRVRPGIVFETVDAIAMQPHVIDVSTLRLHVEASALRHAAGRPDPAVEAVIKCSAGTDCTLRLWGRIKPEASAPSCGKARSAPVSIPAIFTAAFWEISADDARTGRTMSDIAGKDRKIRALEARVALSMCSQ